MSSALPQKGKWNERSSATAVGGADTSSMFHQLFERSSDAIWIFDPIARVFIDCNPAAIALMRAHSKENLLNAGPAEFSPPLQPDGRPSYDFVAEIVELVEKNGCHRFEWITRRMDGSDVPVEVVSTAIREKGQPLHVVVVRDITERREAEEKIKQCNLTLERRIAERAAELTESEARLRTLVEHAPEAIVVFDGDTGQFLSCNQNATQLFGLSLPELLRKTPGDVSPPLQPCGTPSKKLAIEKIRQTLAGEAPVFDWIHLHSNGTHFPCEIRLVRLPAEGKNLVRGSIIDKTERHHMEQALKESEEKFRALFEASSQGIILHDENRFLEVNPALIRILGFNSADEVIGKTPAELAAPVQPGGEPADRAAERHIADCMRHGSARFEWVSRNAKGREIPVEVILTRIPMGGKFIIQAIVDDITERKKAEAELLKTLAREKELGQLKSNFVSMVSHEFRTPLGIIMSSAEILRDYLENLEPEERTEHLESIHKNTRRMSDLMEEVLVLGRLDAGKMEFKPVPVNVAIFCKKICEDVLSASDQQNPILLKVAPDIGSAVADEKLLQHIFVNLLSNAVKYSDPDTPVNFNIARNGRDIVCEIEDRGIGISNADQPWIFSAFHRGRNVGHRAGTGLGLVIVKRCLDLHGGQIQIHSEVGKGTRVVMCIPVFPEHSTA